MIQYIKNLFLLLIKTYIDYKEEKLVSKKLLTFEEWIGVKTNGYMTIDEIFYEDYEDYKNNFIQTERDKKIKELGL